MTTTNTYSKTCTYLGVDYDARTSRVSPAPYCGCSTNGHSSYCAEHYSIVYQAGTANRKRHKDIRRAESVHTLESLFHECVGELELEGELTLD
jgi:hypothetical protein